MTRSHNFAQISVEKTVREIPLIRDYVDHPEHERRICQLLGLTTEEEKAVKAAVSSARSARWSMICAVISSLVALFSVFLRWG